MSENESLLGARAMVTAIVQDYDDEVRITVEDTDGSRIEDMSKGGIDTEELESVLSDLDVDTQGIEMQGDGSVLVGDVEGTEVRDALRDMGYHRVKFKRMGASFHEDGDEEDEQSDDEVEREEDEL